MKSKNTITYRRIRRLPLAQVERLWRSVGWWTAEGRPDLLPDALARSHTVVSAWDGDKLVGVGNALSDGVLVVYYPYLLVDPDYQRRGIGTRILSIMRDRYSALRQHVLLSVEAAVPFYEELGFQLSHAPGMEIMLNTDT